MGGEEPPWGWGQRTVPGAAGALLWVKAEERAIWLSPLFLLNQQPVEPVYQWTLLNGRHRLKMRKTRELGSPSCAAGSDFCFSMSSSSASPCQSTSVYWIASNISLFGLLTEALDMFPHLGCAWGWSILLRQPVSGACGWAQMSACPRGPAIRTFPTTLCEVPT